MEYQTGTLRKCQDLFEAHQREVDGPNMAMGLNVEALFKAEDMGVLRTYTATHDGNVVGYDVFIVSEDIRRKGSISASEVGIYMKPEYRGHFAKEFMKFVDLALPVDVIYRSTNVAKDFGKLLEDLGYLKVATSYAKAKTVQPSEN